MFDEVNMLRFYFVIIISIYLIIYYIVVADHYSDNRDKYDEFSCYNLARRMIGDIQKRANIRTIAYGKDKLPKGEGGYIMYANHQGKYDALGIIASHDEPCSVIMDAKRSRMLLANQVVKLVDGIRLDKTDFRSQVKVLNEMIKQAKNGRRFIYFPEGGYDHNGNTLQEFKPGAFKVAMKAGCPIVPVAIYDSHIPFDYNSLRKVTTQVCFIDPIYPEEYANLSTKEVSDMVKARIEDKLHELEDNRRRLGLNKWFKEYKSGPAQITSQAVNEG